MILAAGQGKRMLPLTANTPKPLLRAAGKTLLEYQLERLQQAGINEVLINVAYLGQQIIDFVGDGSAWGMRITVSEEPYALETGGALAMALPWFEGEAFVLLNADVWCELDYKKFVATGLPKGKLAHLLMVPNPDFHKAGDFALLDNGDLILAEEGLDLALTYAGIAIMSPELIAGYPERRQKFPLREVFDYAIPKALFSAELYAGDWRDIGCPERLLELDRDLSVC